MCDTIGVRELLEISQQTFLKLKDFALKIHSLLGNTYVSESAFSAMKQVKSKNKSNGRRNTGR